MTDSESFKFKSRLTNGTMKVKIPVPLKLLNNFWKTLIKGEITLDLVCWPVNSIICEEDRATKFSTTDAKPYVPVVTLSTQDNAKLFQELKSGFKRTINYNKYLSKVKALAHKNNIYTF